MNQLRMLFYILFSIVIVSCSSKKNQNLVSHPSKYRTVLDSLIANHKVKYAMGLNMEDSLKLINFKASFSFKADSLYLKMMDYDWYIMIADQYLGNLVYIIDIKPGDTLGADCETAHYVPNLNTTFFRFSRQEEEQIRNTLHNMKNNNPDTTGQSECCIDGRQSIIYFDGDCFYFFSSLNHQGAEDFLKEFFQLTRVRYQNALRAR